MNSHSRRRKTPWPKIIIPAFICLFLVISFVIGVNILQPSSAMPNKKKVTSTPTVSIDNSSKIKNDSPTMSSQKIIVAIDPGHGGKDGGAQGIENEKVITERTSKYLFDLLNKDGRFKPIFTHGFDDNSIKFQNTERANNANNANAQLLISIHGNSSAVNTYSGFECFPAPPGLKNHDESLKLAMEIAKLMKDAGHKMRGSNGVRYVYYVGKSGAPEYHEYNYTQKRSDPTLGIIEKSNCPTVLIEQCFINNPNDYKNWGNDEGCKKSANIYYKAICKYFNLDPKSN